jgi:ribonuclease PH
MLPVMNRPDGRQPDALRPVRITPHYLDLPAGSVLIEMGRTRVVCAASIEDGVPRWMREQGVRGGWVTAEYSLLPYAARPRKARELSRGRPEGRTHEIQRLIGRALRAVLDLDRLGERTLWVDCDVLQADGGTRTASVTGASVAVALACRQLQLLGAITGNPLPTAVAAVSVGLVNGQPLLDLCYEEDAAAAVDANIVMTADGKLVEVQAAGEEAPFAEEDLSRLLSLAKTGLAQLFAAQQAALAG